MTRDELIETIRTAIALANKTNFGVVSFANATWIAEAQAALQAIEDAGYVVVPKEPSEAMMDAGRDFLIGDEAKYFYRAMIAAKDE